ncbi:ABC transporter ATP-binding protein [Hoylesella enoeca]|uniref:ABC transporter ATP-binding protein n=1 Tax=Hoylesella enoeca TaxID=76123 RepID=UPI001F46510D|nr:ABC transporter ATP-binding protein [Hoylesella enoeca]
METIRLKDLTVGYPMCGKQAKAVLTDVNATVESGRLTCMLGANGVGKSTLLRTLAGFQTALSGEIRIARQREDDREARAFDEIGRLTKKELARRISVVLTGKPDVQNITATELVGLGRSPYTGFWGSLNEADHRIVDEALQLVGIQALAGRMIQTLSDGERQKVMIAKALAQQTPIILLDEPTAFLDFPSKVDVMQLLRRLAREQDKTILLSTHDLELALQLSDELWMLDAERAYPSARPAHWLRRASSTVILREQTSC